MKKQQGRRANSEGVRRRADDKLIEQEKGPRCDSGDRPALSEMQRLVHELHVHGIELELQNEELKKAREVTDRKKAEDELLKSRKELEQRIDERTAQLASALIDLESFSYSVSHDLQAPLRAIDGHARTILKKAGKQFDADTRRRFEDIRGSIFKMGQLIDALLAFSRLGRREISMSAVDMEAVLQAAWQEQKSIHPDKHMALKSSGLPQAMGDRALITQLVSNILSNAVKFSRFRDEIIVEAGAHREGDETVYIIRDYGAGFDMAYYGKLFGMFERLHNPEEFEGAGVGLAIAHRIVARHGGRIWAEAEVDKGATFYFTLPALHKE
jgi:light-regulated signal transduction histidine kinase (bacteriophytochrome)